MVFIMTPSPDQCALLLLHLLRMRDEEKGSELSRFSVSELTLKRVCVRPRLHAEFIVELQDELLRVGWALFYADRSYGVIKLSAVEAWTKIGSKRIRGDLDAVAEGRFDFKPLTTRVESTPEDSED